MSENRNRVLVDLMNKVANDDNLKSLSDQVFFSVVPFRSREVQDKAVRTAVTLMAVGTSSSEIGSIIHFAESEKRPVEYYQKIVDRLNTIVDEIAEKAISEKPSPETFLRAAISYADVMAGRSGPSPELSALAETMDGDYERAGRAALLEAMQILIRPEAFDLTPELIRFSARLNDAIAAKALDAVSANPDESFLEASVDETGAILVLINTPKGERMMEVKTPKSVENDQAPALA